MAFLYEFDKNLNNAIICLNQGGREYGNSRKKWI